jgi:hypothetical protein
MTSTAPRHVRARAYLVRRMASSATMPPSPRLSARMMRIAYFSEIIRITDQMMSETTEVTACGDTAPFTLAAFTASRKA